MWSQHIHVDSPRKSCVFNNRTKYICNRKNVEFGNESLAFQRWYMYKKETGRFNKLICPCRKQEHPRSRHWICLKPPKWFTNMFFICLLPAISKCTLWLAILPIELDAKHWYSPTSVLFFARLWITLVIIKAPLDPIRLLESAMIFCPSFSHVILEGGGEPSTRQFNVTGSFFRATVFVGSWLKPRGTKGPEKAPEIMFSTKLVRV